MTAGEQTKEITILVKTESILKQLYGLRSKLSDAFNRLPDTEGKSYPERPQEPNVLDEILNNLDNISTKIESIHQDIASKVIAKIL